MIVLLEDDKSIRELVIYALEKTGLEAIGIEKVSDFEKYIAENEVSLILLDIMLPEKDGLDILKELKSNAKTFDIPVIMLTAKDQEYYKLIGLDGGADDYITKPFSVMELISRIKVVLRRTNKVDNLEYANIQLLDSHHIVKVDGEPIDLTLKEYELLKMFIKNKNIVLSRDVILNNIWGYEFDGETRTVDVHVRSLRVKLKQAGKLIRTIRGLGYALGENDAKKNK